MGISEIETTNYALVLIGLNLLKDQPESVEFQNKVDAEVILDVNVEVGSETPLRELRLPKDRIKIITRMSPEIGIHRSEVQMEYPASESSLDRFAEVAGYSISCSKGAGQLRALGYNAVIVYDRDSTMAAHEYLARLFSPPTHPRWNLHGGSCKLEFLEPDQEERRWSLALESRHNDRTTTKIFANLNLHMQTSELPTREEIKSNMESTWNEVERFIRLFEREE